MKVKIKRIDKSLPLPKYETEGAVAFDIIFRETVTVDPKSVGRIPSNVVVEIPKGYMLLIKDRSSATKKKGILTIQGVIDNDYCGEEDEIQVQVYNPTDQPITLERGERLAQGIFVNVGVAEWEEVSEMKSASRGGFGSTG